VAQRDELDSGPLGGVAQRAGAVRGEGDVEPLGEGGEELRDVRLGAAGLGQRDADEQAFFSPQETYRRPGPTP